ncbi:MAG: PAS domain S-box protein [Saonia sp.]
MKVFQKNSNIFNLLSEGVSEGIIVVNEKQLIVASNSSAEEMFGYGKDELIGKLLNTLIPARYHGTHITHFTSFHKKSSKRKMGRNEDLYGVRKNGKELSLEVGLNPFVLYGNTYIMALMKDITERKRIKKDLTIKSEALQSAFNGIIITDALLEDNPIIYYNTAFEVLTGYSEEDIVGKNCRFLQKEDKNQDGIREMNKAIKEGRSCQVIVRNYKKDGTLFWNEIAMTPILDERGSIIHYIGIQNDITERIIAEQERNHWAKIFDESLNEIYVFDSKSFRFVDVNHGAQRNIGYSAEELRSLTPADLMPDYTQEELKQTVAPLTSGKQEKIKFETVHRRKKGSTYPVEVHLQLSTLGNKKVFVAVILDITERKYYTERLEKKVRERTEQLQEALSKEKELNELKTRFLSLVSHEFKTPLSSILTSTTLLSKYTRGDQQEKRNKHVDTIKSKVKYLDTILNDFLSVERLESGKVNYKFTTFPLSKLVNEVVYDANMLLKTGQRIQYPEQIDEQIIEFDEKILELVLSNLLHNAIKYSPEDSIIDIQVHQKGNDLVLKVIDQGMGIPEVDQKFIFNRYFRAQNALLNQGTGIGLNIVRRHLENLDGSITFRSTENVGSTFIIKIPKGLDQNTKDEESAVDRG